MKKAGIRQIAAIVFLTLCLVGCGEETGDAGSTAGTEETTKSTVQETTEQVSETQEGEAETPIVLSIGLS
ncbi:MAG: hypothetical protein LUC27_01555, partial [Lachnospiraceae bacterium]|nr:hypothetical protein [Lachnospiraceae bacterium]